MIRRPPRSTRTDTLFPYTTLFRSLAHGATAMPEFSRRQSRPPTSALNATVNQRLLDCRRKFLGFFCRRLNRPEDAEDALQDFCLKVLRAAETPEDDEKIDSWLGRILRNTLTDHYRRRAARQRAEAACGLEMQTAVFEIPAEQDAKTCRSEERRVGKECVRTCRLRWSAYHKKKKQKIQK